MDHIFDNAALKAASGAPLAIHPDDEYRLAGENVYGFVIEFSSAHKENRHASSCGSGIGSSTSCTRRGTPEGSVCLYEEGHAILLSGHVWFAGSYGCTDLPGGSDKRMVASLARLAREMPDAVRVLPGHGAADGRSPASDHGWSASRPRAAC